MCSNMLYTNNMKHDTFLTLFRQQTEPALMISDTITAQDIDASTPLQGDFISLFSALQKGGRYALPLTADMSREIYDTVKQYTDRHDAVSVFSNGSWKHCDINPDTTRLLLVATTDTMQKLEYPIRHAVGMVFEDTRV